MALPDNKQMNVVIVEDEKPSARRLCRMLKKTDLQISAMLHSVKDAVAWFKKNPPPDLIFLDVQLGDGLSFDIFEQVDLKSAIIFTTAYDEYALKAFKLNSVDYLLKPIDEEELIDAVKRYKQQRLQAPIDLKDLQQILNGQNRAKIYKNRFSVTVGEHLKFFTTNEIACFFSEHKGTYLHTHTNRNYPIDNTLENLEGELSPEFFFRVNRKFLINLNAVQEIITYTNSRLKIKLKNFEEEEIIVSRERVKDFKNWLG